MIKAIITDVDGVMVGKQPGINFPLPHSDIIAALAQVRRHGMPIVLCSAKYWSAIEGIISQAKLANPHITDSGALIIDPSGKPQIIEQHVIHPATVRNYLAHDTAYTEVYTPTTYYVRQGLEPAFTRRRSELLMLEPTVVDSLAETVQALDVIKIISFANDESDMPRIESQVKRLGTAVHYIWSHHPRIMPKRPCVITAPGISKARAARQVATRLEVGLEEVLGIGDSPADWNFMELCGYAATVGPNETLRRLATQKGPNHYFHASTVNDHGLLEIFAYFGIR